MVWELQGCVGVIGCCPLMASAPCVTLMLHCGDHRLHTWHNQGFQFQLALCGTYRLHFAVWFLFEICFVLGKLGVVHFNHAHLAKHQCHISVLVNNIYATIFCSDFSLHWIVDTYTAGSFFRTFSGNLGGWVFRKIEFWQFS